MKFFKETCIYLRSPSNRANLSDFQCLHCSLQTGEPCQSFHPSPPVQARGGGAVIPCQYIVTMTSGTKDATFKSTLARVKSCVENMVERAVLVVEIV